MNRLAQEITKTPPYYFFRDYEGDSSVEAYMVYLEKQFLSYIEKVNLRVRVQWVNLVDYPISTADELLHTGIRILPRGIQQPILY